MKKFLTTALGLLLILSFSACGPRDGGQSIPADVGFEGDELAEIIINQALKKDGIEEVEVFGGEWPDNKCTKLVPAPEIGNVKASMADGLTCVITMDWFEDDAKAYVALLKEAGFNQNVNEDEAVVYYFHANNSDNIEVTVSTVTGILIKLSA